MPIAGSHILRAIVQLEDLSALPADRSVNVFHFDPSTDLAWTSAQLDEVDAALASFYTAAHTGSTNAIAALLGHQLSGIWSIKYYDLDDAEPRTPIRTTTPTAFTPGSTSLPDQVSLCLSYQAQKFSGFPQRNRRGRLYIGPLSSSDEVSTTGLPVTTANGIVPTLCAAGTYLAGGSWSTHGEAWVVYSPTIDAVATVTDGWVDNKFDTQRRRLRAPTARQTWT